MAHIYFKQKKFDLKAGMVMNEHLFLKQLRIELRGLSDNEIETVLEDYRGYFSDARGNGLSEEDTVKSLSHPFDIAQDIKTSQKQATQHTESHVSSSTQSIIVMIFLILFNLIIVLGPAIGVIGGFFGIIISCGLFMILPILVSLKLFFGAGHLFELFLSFILCGISILVFPSLLTLMKKGKHYLNQYVSWNIRLMKGEVS